MFGLCTQWVLLCIHFRLQAYYDELILWCYLCRHPNIVPFLGTYTPEVHKMGLVSKWMVNNTISSFLVKQPDANRLNLVSSSF